MNPSGPSSPYTKNGPVGIDIRIRQRPARAAPEAATPLEVADRIAVLRQGRIAQCGAPSETRRAPASDLVARLFQ